jgi:hypothetical protein
VGSRKAITTRQAPSKICDRRLIATDSHVEPEGAVLRNPGTAGGSAAAMTSPAEVTPLDSNAPGCDLSLVGATPVHRSRGIA